MRAFCGYRIFFHCLKRKKISRFGRHIHLFSFVFIQHQLLIHQIKIIDHFFSRYITRRRRIFLVKIVILKNFLFSNNILYSIIVEEEPLANFPTKEVFRELRIYDSCILLIYGSCNPKQP